MVERIDGGGVYFRAFQNDHGRKHHRFINFEEGDPRLDIALSRLSLLPVFDVDSLHVENLSGNSLRRVISLEVPSGCPDLAPVDREIKPGETRIVKCEVLFAEAAVLRPNPVLVDNDESAERISRRVLSEVYRCNRSDVNVLSTELVPKGEFIEQVKDLLDNGDYVSRFIRSVPEVRQLVNARTSELAYAR